MKHPEYDKLIAIAEGKQMQYKNKAGELMDTTRENALYWLRFAPDTLVIKPPPPMTINGHEFPEPMRVAPNQGTTYFLPSLYSPDEPNVLTWHDDRWDLRWLAAGLCQATKQGAIDQANALLSLLAPEEEKT